MGPSSAVISRRAALLLVAPLWAPAALRPSPAAAAARGVTAPSGVRYIDFRDGTGATPRFGQVVRFHYVGYVSGANGGLDLFDSSYDRNKPYLTKHGNGLTVQGLEEALHTMRVGGQRRVIVPAPLGYTADKGPLPPRSDQRSKLGNAIERGASLVFDLELVSATDDLLDRGDYEVRRHRPGRIARLPAPSRSSDGPVRRAQDDADGFSSWEQSPEGKAALEAAAAEAANKESTTPSSAPPALGADPSLFRR